MLIGYARVSAAHQNLDRQLAILKAEGCGRIFKEKLSGREGVKRPQLDKAIEAQTEFARSSYETFVAESQKIAGLYTDLAKQTFKPYEGLAAKFNPAAN